MLHESPGRCRPADYRAVDLFAGPGGLDVAAEILGVPSVGIEWDAGACATREAAGLRTERGDVRDFGPRDFPEANVLAGGPPCQTFTVAGRGAGRRALDEVLEYIRKIAKREGLDGIKAELDGLEDVRTGLVLQPLFWALEALDEHDLRPYEVIVLEQVPAVLPVWEAYAEVLRGEGYAVAHGILRTEEYGVPQTRRRAVLVAHHGWEDITLPEPTHQAYLKGVARTGPGGAREPWVTMADALQRTRTGSFRTVSNYGTGGDPKARGRRRSCEPSYTVTGKVSRTRVVTDDAAEAELPRLTEREMGSLQTFPERYPWSGNDRSQQIGNAVPPRLGVHVLARALGREIPPGTWERLREWQPGRPAAPAGSSG
ncbi:DNA cytosine methyltransferase [Streptomyces sp. TR06-5]|uniref:DNA cytosine methyltransferase n=1 Tax=Streptomyces sp. TR06-5 TaxID=3385976 RepID=UPI0039A18F3D